MFVNGSGSEQNLLRLQVFTPPEVLDWTDSLLQNCDQQDSNCVHLLFSLVVRRDDSTQPKSKFEAGLFDVISSRQIKGAL